MGLAVIGDLVGLALDVHNDLGGLDRQLAVGGVEVDAEVVVAVGEVAGLEDHIVAAGVRALGLSGAREAEPGLVVQAAGIAEADIVALDAVSRAVVGDLVGLALDLDVDHGGLDDQLAAPEVDGRVEVRVVAFYKIGGDDKRILFGVCACDADLSGRGEHRLVEQAARVVDDGKVIARQSVALAVVGDLFGLADDVDADRSGIDPERDVAQMHVQIEVLCVGAGEIAEIDGQGIIARVGAADSRSRAAVVYHRLAEQTARIAGDPQLESADGVLDPVIGELVAHAVDVDVDHGLVYRQLAVLPVCGADGIVRVVALDAGGFYGARIIAGVRALAARDRDRVAQIGDGELAGRIVFDNDLIAVGGLLGPVVCNRLILADEADVQLGGIDLDLAAHVLAAGHGDREIRVGAYKISLLDRVSVLALVRSAGDGRAAVLDAARIEAFRSSAHNDLEIVRDYRDNFAGVIEGPGIRRVFDPDVDVDRLALGADRRGYEYREHQHAEEQRN